MRPPEAKPRCHKQVPAKATAYVDEGIKELVELLNEYDGVRTFDGCQGRDGKLAYICLHYGDFGTSYGKVSQFVYKMAKVLKQEVMETGKRGIFIPVASEVMLSLRWEGDKRTPFILIEMPADSIGEVVNIFSAVRQQFCYGKDGKQP